MNYFRKGLPVLVSYYNLKLLSDVPLPYWDRGVGRYQCERVLSYM